MVQPAAPASCHSCITTPIVNSYPCQLISGIAQKIADFVTGIFTMIANFVKYCLCMSTAAAAPAPVNPTPAAAANSAPVPTAATTSTTAVPTTTAAPAPASTAHATTSSRPAATTSTPVINPAVVETGKQFFLARVAGIDQSSPQNRFRDRLGTEDNGRRAFATVLVHSALTLPAAQQQPLVNLVSGCAAGLTHTQALIELNTSFAQLEQAQKREALQRLTGARSTPQRPPAEPVTAFLRQASLLRQQFTEDPVFCAAAEAARVELMEVF